MRSHRVHEVESSELRQMQTVLCDPTWCARRDSNPQPPDPQSGVLSIELRAHVGVF